MLSKKRGNIIVRRIKDIEDVKKRTENIGMDRKQSKGKAMRKPNTANGSIWSE